MILELFNVDSGILNLNKDWWRDIISLFLDDGDIYISHWKNDNDIIKNLLNFSSLYREGSFENTYLCKDKRAFISTLNSFSPFYDYEEASLKYSQVFSINIKLLNRKNIRYKFSSSHYGSEIYIINLDENDLEAIKNIVLPIKEYFILRIYNENNDLIEEYQY